MIGPLHSTPLPDTGNRGHRHPCDQPSGALSAPEAKGADAPCVSGKFRFCPTVSFCLFLSASLGLSKIKSSEA